MLDRLVGTLAADRHRRFVSLLCLSRVGPTVGTTPAHRRARRQRVPLAFRWATAASAALRCQAVALAGGAFAPLRREQRSVSVVNGQGRGRHRRAPCGGSGTRPSRSVWLPRFVDSLTRLTLLGSGVVPRRQPLEDGFGSCARAITPRDPSSSRPGRGRGASSISSPCASHAPARTGRTARRQAPGDDSDLASTDRPWACRVRVVRHCGGPLEGQHQHGEQGGRSGPGPHRPSAAKGTKWNVL